MTVYYRAIAELRLAGAGGGYFTRRFPFKAKHTDNPMSLQIPAIEAINAAGMEVCFIHEIRLDDELQDDEAALLINGIRANLIGTLTEPYPSRRKT